VPPHLSNDIYIYILSHVANIERGYLKEIWIQEYESNYASSNDEKRNERRASLIQVEKECALSMMR